MITVCVLKESPEKSSFDGYCFLFLLYSPFHMQLFFFSFVGDCVMCRREEIVTIPLCLLFGKMSKDEDEVEKASYLATADYELATNW